MPRVFRVLKYKFFQNKKTKQSDKHYDHDKSRQNKFITLLSFFSPETEK